MIMKSQLWKIVKNLLYTLWMPVVVYIFFSMLCAANGKTGFGVDSDMMIILRNTIYSGLIALALSYNLTSGRFDFSIGSILILSTIIGANIALSQGLGPISMIAVCMTVGAILGTISGLVYIILRLPPIVVSVGVAMIYEGIGFLVNDGKGVRVINNPDLLIFAQQPYISILAIIILIVLVILLNFTKFGFDTNSLRGGQAIAVNIGINEKSNTLICYLIAGALMAAAGVISLSILGNMSPKLGLSSSSYMMNAFLPMFIGGFLAKYSDRNIGIMVGSFTQACIISGFAILGLSISLQLVLNSLIVLAFLVFTSNSYKIAEFQMMKEKRLKAELALEKAG
jgi:ribose transport system permease protein